jgi:hypothetical protein
LIEKYGFYGSKTTCFIARDGNDIKIINIIDVTLCVSVDYKENDIIFKKITSLKKVVGWFD